jgi:hypothetical protein
MKYIQLQKHMMNHILMINITIELCHGVTYQEMVLPGEENNRIRH